MGSLAILLLVVLCQPSSVAKPAIAVRGRRSLHFSAFFLALSCAGSYFARFCAVAGEADFGSSAPTFIAALPLRPSPFLDGPIYRLASSSFARRHYIRFGSNEQKP